MNVSFSWAVIAFALAVSLLNVLISANIPARKMAKLPAVEGINQSPLKVKKRAIYYYKGYWESKGSWQQSNLQRTRRVVNLIGLSDESFEEYCVEVGTDSEKYYNNNEVMGILEDSTYHIPANSKELLIDMLVGDENSAKVKDKIMQICNSNLSSGDFKVWSLLEEKNHDALIQKAIAAAVYAVAIMIGAIGIFNAFSTITNNLQLHKREYAMLRSVGLNKILLLEGLSFAISPLIISIPCVLLICWYMLNLTVTTCKEFISVFPVGAILLYTGCIFISIFLAYWFSSKIIKQGNVIEAIKNEIV